MCLLSRSDRSVVRAVCGVLLFLAPASGSGATLYNALAYTSIGGTNGSGGSTPVSAVAGDCIYTHTTSQCGNAFASADLSLAAEASAQAVNVDPNGYPLGVGSGGEARYSEYDVILSGPSGESTLASLDLTFDGVASFRGANGYATANIETSWTGPSGTATDAGAIRAPGTGSGLLSAWTGSPLAVTTSPLLVGAGDVITVGLSLSISRMDGPRTRSTERS